MHNVRDDAHHAERVARNERYRCPSRCWAAVSRERNPKVFADLSRQMIVNVVVTRNGASSILRGVMPPRVFPAFPKK